MRGRTRGRAWNQWAKMFECALSRQDGEEYFGGKSTKYLCPWKSAATSSFTVLEAQICSIHVLVKIQKTG